MASETAEKWFSLEGQEGVALVLQHQLTVLPKEYVVQ